VISETLAGGDGRESKNFPTPLHLNCLSAGDNVGL
jgi:hypothetical protein